MTTFVDLFVYGFYQPILAQITDISISAYILSDIKTLYINYKYRMEKVTPAECVSMGDKTAGVRKCNSYLTNG